VRQPAFILYVVLGLLAAGLLAIGVSLVGFGMARGPRDFRYFGSMGGVNPHTAVVFVAREDIPAGTSIIHPDMHFRIRIYRIGTEPAGCVREWDHLRNKIAIRPIARGEACRIEHLESGLFRKFRMPDGTQAMLIHVQWDAGMWRDFPAGNASLLPGMRLTILRLGDKGADRVVASDVRVLEAARPGVNLPPIAKDVGAGVNEVLVEVTDAQAAQIADAARFDPLTARLSRPAAP
jgi:hypothetical protein